MDFKVAGDENGISALQMDIKVEGITPAIMGKALAQAKEGRIHILNIMKQAMPTHRQVLPSSVPKVKVMPIPVKKIGDLIGPGGKQIKAVIEECGGESLVNINIAQEGIVTIMSVDPNVIEKAVTLISSIVLEVTIGQRFSGRVTKILPFGAYIELAPGKEAWCHISELEYKRTEKVEDVCKEGDILTVQVTEVGRGGQFRVSRKPLLPAPPKAEGNGQTQVDGDGAKGEDERKSRSGTKRKHVRSSSSTSSGASSPAPSTTSAITTDSESDAK
eukprot:Plantae.Rhodophyta-Purpureofilum_apyrenoidigerum.ctg53998.p1 GENE.Plantae.Rhodophyta-Purpureofilum_apyrenoidigerum.ctg53998~~Plantae.Rhodophyta-Purpureofilum_apyrenoidigerum.ctg53998.p1  ORF type:complete len:305 (+),score=61.43 Plantae.Rhodophyta-Purpureofilum_apyrenoidigerum.ctg53998:94-915(+)